VPRYLALPDGDTYRVRLYDSLIIPFVLGSDPFLDLLQEEVNITLTGQPVDSELRPVYRKLSLYRGEVFFNQTASSHAGQYSLQVTIAGDIIASADLSIFVNRKNI
jgi:hypothetical protein